MACKDFTSVGIVLQDFASLKNQVIDSERNGYGTELADMDTLCASLAQAMDVKAPERSWPFTAFRSMRSLL